MWDPPCFRIAQATRVILFASATIASIGGFLCRMLASQALVLIFPRLTQETTALAPMISRRLSVRSPILDIRPNRCFPPVDRSSGVKPTHAAKSRPLRKVAGSGARAAIAAALIPKNWTVHNWSFPR